jgi:hypothetical protein
MSTTTDDTTRLAAEIARLAATLEHAHARQESLRRVQRWTVGALLAALALVGTAVYLGAAPQVLAQAPMQAQSPAALSPEAARAERERLLAALSPAEREELQEFERKVAWLSRYLAASPEFNPGAAVALFLAQMAESVAAVPGMKAEMRSMNAKMNALPVLATEVQGMHGKMSVMAAGMDSTMGRAGRMLPWGW